MKLVKTVSGNLVCVVRLVDDEMMTCITNEEREAAVMKCARINKWI